jgi:hypothetical protein
MTDAQRGALDKMTGASWREVEVGTLLVTPMAGASFLLGPDGRRDALSVQRVYQPNEAGRMIVEAPP